MDIVSELAKANFRLFPLKGKVPAIPAGTNWKEIDKDPNLCVFDFEENYAVHAEDTLIIDVDCKKGQKGKESFKQLTEDLQLGKNWESDTFVVRTGTGGYHIYLKITQDINIKKHYKKYPGIDFLYGPAYAVGPGSIHPDTGKEYTVLFGTPNSIIEAPENLKTFLNVKEVVTTGVDPEPGFVDDDPMNVDHFISLVNSMPVVHKGEGQTNNCYIVACRARDLGLSKAKALEIIDQTYNKEKLIPPVSFQELEHQINSAYNYAKGKMGGLNAKAMFETVEVGDDTPIDSLKYDVDRNKKIARSLNNAVNYLLSLQPVSKVFRFNAFTSMLEIQSKAPWYKERGERGANICDEDIILLKYFLTKAVGIEFSRQIIEEAVTVVAHRRHYHPVRNYLNSLVWDGVPRLDTWLIKYGHALDTVYTRAIARKTLCAAVRRVYEPGCKWDFVLVIEGVQGIGKSTACRILGRSWAGDMNLDPHNKDSVAMMLGKWIIELSEMTALKWADSNALKSFITRGSDTARLSYQRHAKDYPRQSIFMGTVNPEHVGYLNDITGNRRYWVVRFNGPVDMVGLENDCDQLWAEAKAVYKNEVLYLTGEAERLQIVETLARMPEDPMRSNVMSWANANPEITEVTTVDILGYLGMNLKSMTRGDQNRIAQALVETGWTKKSIMENGLHTTKYIRPIREEDVL
ncbi:MAG: bifunctional DNA primase/polymerase [Bacteroidales bacterium]|nr:bifunctional DNA primase/polymerase [Bacteroidales bacterium]